MLTMELFSNSINLGLMPITCIPTQSYQLSAGESAIEAPPVPLIFGHNVLYPGQQLMKGHSLHLSGEEISLPEGNTRLWTSAELIMQQDGKLVLYITYNESKRVPVWMALGSGFCAELNKGQLAVMTGSPYGVVRDWCSDNRNEKGAYLLLEEHAGMPRLALYNLSNRVVWASDLNDGWQYDNTPW